MLAPLWRELHLVPKASQKGDAPVAAQWMTCYQNSPGSVGKKGPAYALIDSRIVGSPTYWKHFTDVYPREAKRLFRQVISALKIGDLEKAALLLSDAAWLPISL